MASWNLSAGGGGGGGLIINLTLVPKMNLYHPK